MRYIARFEKQPINDRSIGAWCVFTKHDIQFGISMWFVDFFFHATANDMWLKLHNGSMQRNPRYMNDEIYSWYFPR